VVEIVDKYEPDLMWFDFGFEAAEYESYRKKLAAYYYNKGIECDKGVVLNYKHQAYPDYAAVLDIERGKLDELRRYFWQTDTSVCRRSWGYIDNHDYKSVDQLVDNLVDIVSKNGCLLLNIAPRPDGTIPAEQEHILMGIGKWLNLNGEAIYGTRPWVGSGEGPTLEQAGYYSEDDASFTRQDIRFTRNGNVLYAIFLAWPGKEAIVRSLGKDVMPNLVIEDVSMLGISEKLQWIHDGEGLKAILSKLPCENAYVLRIKISGWGAGGFAARNVDLKTIQTKLTLDNFSERTVRDEVKMLLDGKAVVNQSVTLKPSVMEDIILSYQVDNWGIYEISMSSGGLIVGSRQVVVSGIDLGGEWSFNRGDNMRWKEQAYDDAGWQQVVLPERWENHSAYTEDPAYGWYRKKVFVPEIWEGKALILPLGQLDDIDETFFNGKRIGGLGHFPPNWDETEWYQPRRYEVPAELINYGDENLIAIRVYDNGGGGGMHAGPLGPVEVVE
jgi:hypothetical protein